MRQALFGTKFGTNPHLVLDLTYFHMRYCGRSINGVRIVGGRGNENELRATVAILFFGAPPDPGIYQEKVRERARNSKVVQRR
jgi:hypothetical protein